MIVKMEIKAKEGWRYEEVERVDFKSTQLGCGELFLFKKGSPQEKIRIEGETVYLLNNEGKTIEKLI
jgi:hypothetical protein